MIGSERSTWSTTPAVSASLPLAMRAGALIFADTLQFWPCSGKAQVTFPQSANFINMLEVSGEAARVLAGAQLLKPGQNFSLAGSVSNSGWASSVSSGALSLSFVGQLNGALGTDIQIAYSGSGFAAPGMPYAAVGTTSFPVANNLYGSAEFAMTHNFRDPLSFATISGWTAAAEAIVGCAVGSIIAGAPCLPVAAFALAYSVAVFSLAGPPGLPLPPTFPFPPGVPIGSPGPTFPISNLENVQSVDFANHTFSANSGNLINISGNFGNFNADGSVSFVGNVSVVPEPSALASMLAAGLAGLAYIGARRQRSRSAPLVRRG